MSFIIFLGLAFVGVTSFWLTNLVRKYALQKNILDIPNERSSHTQVTPRGGGLGFVTIFLFFIVILSIYRYIPLNIGLAISGGGILIAFLGWLDDKKGLTAKTRFVFHLIAAVWALGWLGGLPSLDLGFKSFYIGGFGWLIGVIGIVWMINLYNFMDGIDGIAGTGAVMVASSVGIILFLVGFVEIAVICGLLAVSVLGFLVWNWPPAQIFMGDIGSGFLGYVLAILAIATEQNGAIPLLVWLILLSVFLVDATVTLIRRIIQGEKWYEAHRTHVYQLAVQAGYTHKQVTLRVGLINVLLMIIATTAFINMKWMLIIAISLIIVSVGIHQILYKKFKEIIEKINTAKQFEDEVKGYDEVAGVMEQDSL